MSDTLKLVKVDGGFNIEFSIVNTSIDLVKIFDFTIMDILYEVNKNDLIHGYKLDCLEGNIHAQVNFIFKHLFKDIGMPQFYMNMDLRKSQQENVIIYNCVKSLNEHPLQNIPVSNYNHNAPINEMNVTCLFPSPSNAVCQVTILLDHTYGHLSKYEPMLISIFKKMFKKVKGFIESSV